MKKYIYFPVTALLFTLISCSGQKQLGSEYPQWLNQKIRSLQEAPVQNPPAAVYQYTYLGNTVFFIPAPCCDQMSTLYSYSGDVICSPDGGITGKGDGKCPQFFSQRSDEKLLWQDDRKRPGEERRMAPVEAVPHQQQKQEINK